MDTFEAINIVKAPFLVGTFIGLSLLYFASQLVYRTFFDPLRHIPGPWINAVSRIPYARHLLKGTTANNVLQLHEQYGDVVRLSPNEVSFISGETAWQDIYGFRTGKLKGQANMEKDPTWYSQPPNGVSNILVSNDEDHSRYRRTFAHAFSEKALANQEVLLQQYVDFLISRLKEVTPKDETQDIAKWYNWTTFDIIADLTFGEPFGCLRDLATHKFIGGIFNSLNSWRIWYIMSWWPITKHLNNLIIDQSVMQRRREFYVWVTGRTKNRIETETQRPDFMTEVLKHNGDKGAELTPTEITNNNVILLGAGSETTASLLSATSYCLLRNPQVMEKLKCEVRGRWKKYDEITLDEVNKAPYLLAVLQECLRYMPPVPTGFERRVPQGGAVVSGHYLPEGTGVCVSSLPLGRSEEYFKDAKSFIPERWLDDPRFIGDKRDTVQPFNVGPRNCLGKNLAYAEMRLILAKMIWSFDLELDPISNKWAEECKVRTVWVRPPLWVKVKEVVRD